MLTHQDEKNHSFLSRVDSKRLLIEIILAVFIAMIALPGIQNILLYLGIPKVPLVGYPLENIRPSIDIYHPQNTQSFDYNETVNIFAKLSDGGGSGIDISSSNITIEINGKQIPLDRQNDTEDQINFYPLEQLQYGTYTMRITARDKAGNIAESLSTFFIKKRPIVKLNQYIDSPVIINNRTYAKIILENAGDLPLTDFYVGFTDMYHTDFSWVEQDTHILLPGGQVQLFLPTALNLSCKYGKGADSDLYLDQNKNIYILVKNESQRVCMWSTVQVKVFSMTDDYQMDLGEFLYPYYEGNLNISILPNSPNTRIVHNINEIPLKSSRINISVMSISDLCMSKPTYAFEWCYNQSKIS